MGIEPIPVTFYVHRKLQSPYYFELDKSGVLSIFDQETYRRNMKPLIFDYQILRSENDLPIVYEYDPQLCLNVIDVNGLKIPFIDVNVNDIELMTKTKQNRERDDDHHSLLELETKSQDSKERDDRDNMLLELQTKTLQARESDDVRNNYLLELNTKTRADRERDDEHFNHN